MATPFNVEQFTAQPDKYTVIDVRNTAEVSDGKIFPHAIAIPLPELRERLQEIPLHQPLVVHCAAGYRSAAAVSIIQPFVNGTIRVYDLGEAIYQFIF